MDHPEEGERMLDESDMEVKMEAGTSETATWHACALRRQNLSEHVLDEIALEGLDGITMQALEMRLKERRGVPIVMTPKAMSQVWAIITKMQGISVYELPEARPDLVLYKREDFVDERGGFYEPLSAPEDIYQYNPISKGSVRGSCVHFTTRKLLPDAKRIPFERLATQYGNKLVVVASQKLRERALLGRSSEGSANLTIIQFCMLERIGRARYLGEMTRGKVSLNVMKIDPKALHYQRKFLLKKRMITKQVFSMKFGEHRATSLISVLHLPRFYKRLVPVPVLYAKRMIAHLKTRPEFREESASIKKIFGKTVYKTLLLPEFSRIFAEKEVSMACLNPKAFEEEMIKKKRESMLKRTQKTIVFLDPPGDIDSYFPRTMEPDLRGKENTEKNKFLWGVIRRPEAHLFDTQTHIAQELIACAGDKGVTLNQIQGILRMHTLAARSAGRLSVKLSVATTSLVEKKKTKAFRYTTTLPALPESISKKYEDKLAVDQDTIMASRRKSKQEALKKQKAEKISMRIKKPRVTSALEEPSEAEVTDAMLGGDVPSLMEAEMDTECAEEPQQHAGETKRKRKMTTNREEDRKRHRLSDQTSIKRPSKVLSKEARFLKILKGIDEARSNKVNQTPPKTARKVKPADSVPAYYDKEDLEALSRKVQLRVKWDPTEDKLILLLFISSVVFITQYPLKKLYIFNSAQLRDMLHIKNEDSQSKTSLAIRRRFHFLIKNPVFRDQYTKYLYDAINDEFVKKTFVVPRLRDRDDPQKIFWDVPTEAILDVFEYFSVKYRRELEAHWRPSDEALEAYATFADSQNVEISAVPEDDSGVAPSEVFQGCPSVFRLETINAWAPEDDSYSIVDGKRDIQSPDDIPKWIGRTLMMSILFCDNVPDSAKEFVSLIGENKLEKLTDKLRRLNIVSFMRSSRRLGLSNTMRKKLSFHVNPTSYKIAKQFIDSAKTQPTDAMSEMASSLSSLYSVGDFLFQQQVDFDIKPNETYVTQNWTQDTKFFSSATPFRLRKNRPEDTTESAKVTLPQITAKVLVPTTPIKSEVISPLKNLLFQNIEGEPEHPPSRYSLLYDLVEAGESSGVSLSLLSAKFSLESLSNGLNYLMAEKYIYCTGATVRRFVSSQFCEAWSIPLSNEENYPRLMMHSWITPDKQVNWEMLDWLMVTIVGVLTRHPGKHFRKLLQSLHPLVSSVELTILLQVLLQVDLIRCYNFKRSPQFGLFSEADTETAEPVPVPVSDYFLKLENLYYELCPMGHVRYASFQLQLREEPTSFATDDIKCIVRHSVPDITGSAVPERERTSIQQEPPSTEGITSEKERAPRVRPKAKLKPNSGIRRSTRSQK